MEPNRRRARLFRVFEAGSGQRPAGLFLQAARAEKRHLGKRPFTGRERKFIGVDTKEVNFDMMLKKAGLAKMPENLKIRQQCAVDALKKLEPESQDVIFASYLLSVLSFQKGTWADSDLRLDDVFAREAVRALRSGGRLVVVQSKAHADDIKSLAAKFKLIPHMVDISDEKAKKSPAKYIRQRSSAERRMKRVRMHLSAGSLPMSELNRVLSARIIQSPEEFEKPVIFVLRKPRNLH